MKWDTALELLHAKSDHLNDDDVAEINVGDLRLVIKTLERWKEETCQSPAKKPEDPPDWMPRSWRG